MLQVLRKKPTFSTLSSFWPALEEAKTVAKIFNTCFENKLKNETRELATNVSIT